MSTSRHYVIGLAVLVIVWYLGLAYLPQIVGTCLDAECGFSSGEIMVSLIIPLAFFAVPVVLEMVLDKKGLVQALSDIGLIRFNWTGIRLALMVLLPLIVYPLVSLLTNTPLATQPGWQWRILNVVLVNGLTEETMMRGFVFRHLREGRTFWHAAALSTLFFVGYHLPLIVTSGVLVGVIVVVLAIPTGFLTAYLYERGNNTVWGPVLLHSLYNSLYLLFALTTDIQPIVTLLYLLVGLVVSTTVLVWAYRGHYAQA